MQYLKQLNEISLLGCAILLKLETMMSQTMAKPKIRTGRLGVMRTTQSFLDFLEKHAHSGQRTKFIEQAINYYSEIAKDFIVFAWCEKQRQIELRVFWSGDVVKAKADLKKQGFKVLKLRYYSWGNGAEKGTAPRDKMLSGFMMPPETMELIESVRAKENLTKTGLIERAVYAFANKVGECYPFWVEWANEDNMNEIGGQLTWAKTEKDALNSLGESYSFKGIRKLEVGKTFIFQLPNLT